MTTIEAELKAKLANERWRAIERCALVCEKRQQMMSDPKQPSRLPQDQRDTRAIEAEFLAREIRELHNQKDDEL